ncbi:MAG TPA: hypothetical protein PK863_05600 [Candidatus Dojkabacteria bacterium]|nr:hypothetical protein [Candidatus Dojkabacteria bacterium]
MPKNDNSELDSYKFPGFSSPRYTQIPDVVFDELQHRLSGAEYKVLMYILRRTFGFKKDADNISLRQMREGIVKSDGTRLDYGAGVQSKATLVSAVRKLEEMGIVLATRNSSNERGDEATTYTVNMGGDARVQKLNTPPGTKIEHPRVQKLNTQETVKQETEKQQHVVVAFLVSRGIGKQIAQALASNHDERYIRQKATYLDFLLDVSPEKVRNPKGWLRRAIEEDYGAPDGFMTQEEREAQRLEEVRLERSLMEEKKKLAREEEAEKRRKEEELLNWSKTVRKQYKTPSELIGVWSNLTDRVEALEGQSFFTTYLKRSLLASAGNGEAVIVSPDDNIARLFRVKFRQRLESELNNSGLQVDNLEVVSWSNGLAEEANG